MMMKMAPHPPSHSHQLDPPPPVKLRLLVCPEECHFLKSSKGPKVARFPTIWQLFQNKSDWLSIAVFDELPIQAAKIHTEKCSVRFHVLSFQLGFTSKSSRSSSPDSNISISDLSCKIMLEQWRMVTSSTVQNGSVRGILRLYQRTMENWPNELSDFSRSEPNQFTSERQVPRSSIGKTWVLKMTLFIIDDVPQINDDSQVFRVCLPGWTSEKLRFQQTPRLCVTPLFGRTHRRTPSSCSQPLPGGLYFRCSTT